MHPTKFSTLAARRLDQCSSVLVAKAQEYSRGNDRLHNFKRAALLQGITPAEALRGMWAKHLVSIMDIIDDLSMGTVPSQAMVDEKISDTINYAVLLEGLISEQQEVVLPDAADLVPIATEHAINNLGNLCRKSIPGVNA